MKVLHDPSCFVSGTTTVPTLADTPLLLLLKGGEECGEGIYENNIIMYSQMMPWTMNYVGILIYVLNK